MKEQLLILGDVIMFMAALGATAFAISYATFFAWRRTPAGRSLMYFVLALVAWAAQSFISRLNPNYLGREWIRIGIYASIAITIWRLVATLWWSWKRTPFEVERRKQYEMKEKD